MVVMVTYNSCLRGFLRGDASSTFGPAAAAASMENPLGAAPAPGKQKIFAHLMFSALFSILFYYTIHICIFPLKMYLLTYLHLTSIQLKEHCNTIFLNYGMMHISG